MTKTKKCLKIFLIVFGCIIGEVITFVFAAALPWIIIFLGMMVDENPPQPEVAYGEFPFKLVYEYNGKRMTIEDTLIIEYEGVKANEANGKYNAWNRYYKSKKRIDDNKLVLFGGFDKDTDSVKIKIIFELGSCEYYMGLEEEDDTYYQYHGIQPGDIYITSSEYTRPLSNEELWSKYNIKIIEKYISPPITEKQEDP